MVKRLPALLLCTAWSIAWWTLYPRLGPHIKAWGLSLLGPTADYFFTYMGPELLIFAFGLVVLPLLYFFLLRLLAYWLQLLLVPALLISCVFAVYFDVFLIAREAERLCTTEAGMRVYKTVEAEGIYGVSDIRYWADYGFRWVEYPNHQGSAIRARLLSGKIVEQRVSTLMSTYEYTISPHIPVSTGVGRSIELIRDRLTGDVIAESVYFHTYEGWIDEVLDVGIRRNPSICASKNSIIESKYISSFGTNFIKRAVRPKSR